MDELMVNEKQQLLLEVDKKKYMRFKSLAHENEQKIYKLMNEAIQEFIDNKIKDWEEGNE